MKKKLIRFISFFAYFFIVFFFFGSSSTIWETLFMSTGMAIFFALMYGPFGKFITWMVKKIVKPRPQ